MRNPLQAVFDTLDAYKDYFDDLTERVDKLIGALRTKFMT